jgi:hypothetical protein
MADGTAKRKLSKRSKWLIGLAIAFVVYTLFGFFLVPVIVKSQMLKRLPALTKREAFIKQVKFNPFALSLTIRGFALKEPDGEVFSSFDEFYVNFQLWASLFKRSLVFDEITLKGPFAQIIYGEDGNFNFANLIDNTPAPPKTNAPSPPPRLLVYSLNITNGSIGFSDLKRKVPFNTKFIPINIALTNLTTIRDRNSPYSFIARTDAGETFAWAGTVTLNPLRSQGEFRLGGLKLAKYGTYGHDFAKFEIANGLLDVAADYHFDSSANAQDISVSNAAIHLSNLELKAPDTGETMLSLPIFSITKTDASVASHAARVGLIKSSNASLLVRRNHDNTINLLEMLNLPAPSTNATAPKTDAVQPGSGDIPWVAKIDEIAFDNYTINIEDKQPSTPASIKIDQLGFNLKGVSNVSNAPVAVSLSLRYAETGFITVDGAATLMPPSADLQISLTNLDLRPIQPYVQQQLKLAITGGAFDLQGHARYASPEPGAPLINFTGSLALNKFASTDDVLFKDFAKWDSLTVSGIKFDAQPDKAQVDEVKFTVLNTSLIVGPDHRVNLQTILRDHVASSNAAAVSAVPVAASSAPASVKPPLPNVALGAFVLENSSIHFADQSLEPHCKFDIQEFGGSILGLSSQPGSTATVDFKGKVDARSPFSVTGKLGILGGDPAADLRTNIFADITVAFTNTELTAFSPYSETFVGRPLSKGKLSFAVHYLIDKGTLKAENGFYIDQLTLGPKNNSTNATKLPVNLAIKLLRDPSGRINLDIPLSGRIDDPKFKVGPIIWHVVFNLLEKAALSPFSLLGGLFGGGGDELSFVAFEPGESAIPGAETNKLEKLVKALNARPLLNLEINGSVNTTNDRLPLARAKLDREIKTMWVKELTDAGKPAIAIEEVTLEPREHDRLLRRIYKKELGQYKPTELNTNAPDGGTNSAAQVIALPPENPGDERGASMLFARPKPLPVVKPRPTKAGAIAGKPVKPPTRSELELLDMEDQLVDRREVTSDDFRDLMQARAKEVQSYLLKANRISAERLFLTAPKTIDASFKGDDKVDLSLD